MLKLKLQYLDHLMRRADSFEKTLILGKIEGGRRRGWQRTRWLDGITNSIDMSLSRIQELWWTGKPGVLQLMGSQRVRPDLATEQQAVVWNLSCSSNCPPRMSLTVSAGAGLVPSCQGAHTCTNKLPHRFLTLFAVPMFADSPAKRSWWRCSRSALHSTLLPLQA